MSAQVSESSITKVAVVTGGSRGLGRSTVLNLAERGIVSIFTYNSSRDEATKVVEAARQKGTKAVALQLNTGKVSEFDGFVKNVESTLADLGVEALDYLVNNAGIWYTDPGKTVETYYLTGVPPRSPQ